MNTCLKQCPGNACIKQRFKWGMTLRTTNLWELTRDIEPTSERNEVVKQPVGL